MDEESEATRGQRVRPGPSGLLTLAAAYIRVSSRSQDYEYQRTAIMGAARARGEMIHQWFADVASGRSMQRPQLQKLRDAIRQGRIHKLWVWRLDRLTRSGIVDAIQAVQEMNKHGCELVSISDAFPLNEPTTEVILAVLAWAAQMERNKIRENQHAARLRMQQQGRPWGRPPLTPEVRLRILELRESSASERQIARELKVSKTAVHNVLRSTGP